MNQKSSMSLEKDNIALFNRVCLFESKTTTSFKTQINNMFIHQSIYTILKQFLPLNHAGELVFYVTIMIFIRVIACICT